MTVYVDSLMPSAPNTHWRFKESCHMFADSEEELHQFAELIGLKRGWFQSHTRLDHYDLTASKRILALKHGAIEASRKETVAHMRPRACQV